MAELTSRAAGAARWVLARGGRTRVTGVDDSGLQLVVHGEDRVVDVLFDGRRIWSFWLLRDTERVEGHLVHRTVEWPERMRRYLKGGTELVVREHVAGTDLFHGEHQFGEEPGRVRFVNSQGLEISLDKSGRFSPTFGGRSEEHLRPLLDAMDTVIAMLRELGVEAFPAYGTLLGAVREGQFLGHDSDADLGYVSRHSTPVDVITESYHLQRAVIERGFSTYRYSGAAFRIDVRESDGSVRGLDLFGGFMDGGRLYLMGEVGMPYDESWLFPLTTCTLAGREYPAPAKPEKLLEAMYGPSWKVPDPAFKFETPRSTTRRLNDWFRGMTVYRREWERRLVGAGGKAPRGAPSGLARTVLDQVPADAQVLDVGAGLGRDAFWLASQGREVVAYDYVPRGSRGAVASAGKRGFDLTSRPLNLTDFRSVLSEGARVAREPREPGKRVILARHVLDATNRTGREGLVRFASMALRGGGTLYADTWTGRGEPPFGVRPVEVDHLRALLEQHGGTILSAEDVTDGDAPNQVRRWVVQWA
ncbi:class I SAM-dependent methyltransferase [Nocardioides sp. J54]|uniref:class I SAM-dependent methyltransferase n=1 Tax=Nocardioides sp. J54 TaxID=935866 RepID=UPI0004BB251F|nr:hypothetical protein [Nocardioides sp. J54]